MSTDENPLSRGKKKKIDGNKFEIGGRKKTISIKKRKESLPRGHKRKFRLQQGVFRPRTVWPGEKGGYVKKQKGEQRFASARFLLPFTLGESVPATSTEAI